MFRKVLIANRGEIALRVISACKEMGIRTVAVYSEADRNSLHVKFADEAVCIGPPPSRDSYLNVPAIISAAEITGGGGGASGVWAAKRKCELRGGLQGVELEVHWAAAGGDADDGREVHRAPDDEEGEGADSAGVGWCDRERGSGAGVGTVGRVPRDFEGRGWWGGGRGMRIVRSKEELPGMYQSASQEALNAFSNGDMYMEKFIERPRHIEFQVLADEHGNVMSLGERECSIQRRHQKLIEEAPSLQITPKQRKEMGGDYREVAQRDWVLECGDDRVPDG